jgi:hypothetical protein
MQAGLLPPAIPVAGDPAAGSDLLITMLDGGLGAVTSSSEAVLPQADALCWCDCVVCVVGTGIATQ